MSHVPNRRESDEARDTGRRRPYVLGRRRSDVVIKDLPSRKAVAIIVTCINFVYLVVSALLQSDLHCF